MKLWNGFYEEDLIFDGREAKIIHPKEDTKNGYLAVKTEYWDAFPEAIETELLKAGFYLCNIKNDNRWGTDEVIDTQAEFIKCVTEKYNLNKKAVLVGMSCGGLIAIKLAAKHPEIVSCMYLDAPVLNYLSCPCRVGRNEKDVNEDAVVEVIRALGLKDFSELLGYREMPLDSLPNLIKARIPAFMVTGDSDTIVPFNENGIYLKNAYENAGIDIEIRVKPGANHHPHGWKNKVEIMDFILKHI